MLRTEKQLLQGRAGGSAKWGHILQLGDILPQPSQLQFRVHSGGCLRSQRGDERQAITVDHSPGREGLLPPVALWGQQRAASYLRKRKGKPCWPGLEKAEE